MKNLFITVLTVSVAIGLTACRVEVKEKVGTGDNPSLAVSSKTHMYAIGWGYHKDRLEYVAFSGEKLPSSATGIVNGEISRDIKQDGTMAGSVKRNFWIARPDGTKVSLPSTVQLFEKIDGKYFESNERVTLEEFKAFLDSKPDEYDIPHLVAFSKALRIKK